MDNLLERTKDAIIRNRMNAVVVSTPEEALEKVKELIPEGSVISVGGSVTLKECKIIDEIKSEKYKFIDRSEAGLSPEETKKRMREAFFSDFFLSSANAITENGEIYNVDGRANRVAALLYGPDKVIIVAGKNKIVPDLKAAEIRVKAHAAPKNTERLGCNTYCKEYGHCVSLGKGGMTAGCNSPDRICCSYVVLGPQRDSERITVILVDAPLGY